jgi:hypothetical protein
MTSTVATTAMAALTLGTVSTFATDWANTVHHVIESSLELCKLGVSFSLCVLSGSNLFIKVRFEICSERCLYICNVNVLSVSNLLDGLA